MVSRVLSRRSAAPRRRKLVWAYQTILTTAPSDLVIDTFASLLAVNRKPLGFTIMRTIVELQATQNSGVATASWAIRCGLIKHETVVAPSVGLLSQTSQPDFHWNSMYFRKPSGTLAQDSIRISIDTKARRKVEEANDSVYLLCTVAAGGPTVVEYEGIVRTLIALP